MDTVRVGARWAAYDFDSGALVGGGVETSTLELQDIAAIKTGRPASPSRA